MMMMMIHVKAIFNFSALIICLLFQARARLTSTVEEIIQEREKRSKVGSGVNVDDQEAGDFLDVILSKPRCLLNREVVVSLVVDLMLGGYETTATLMSLIVYFLAHSPNALQKLKVPPSFSQGKYSRADEHHHISTIKRQS
jgi:cytochrome P450